MFDSTLHAKTIARQFRKADFHSRLWQVTPADKPHIITSAVEIASTGFHGVALRVSQQGGKPVYQHTSLSEALLVRHVSESVRRITRVRQSDRQSIIRSILALATEGVPFKIFKMDIKSFYESVNVEQVLSSLSSDAIFSRQSIKILESLFAALGRQGIAGLPRGIGLSATLAEYTMRKFDATVAALPGVRFYNRYVDDAIFVTADYVDLAQLRCFVEETLPSGLSLNNAKTKGFEFLPYTKANTGCREHKITFLGYEIDIGEAVKIGKNVGRRVVADISEKKVQKIKRRLAKALLAYNNGGPFADLHLRIKLLTSNYGFVDTATGQQRFSGLRYNYGLIDAQSSAAIQGLDRYLTNVITSTHPGNRIRPHLSHSEQHSLLGLRFESGFTTNRFFSFSYDELKSAIGCWSHA
jgi:hypothetical protein